MDNASHADPGLESKVVRVGSLDFESIESAAREVHDKGRKELWDVLMSLDRSQHHRARRVACARLLKAYERHGLAALKVVKNVRERSLDKKKPTRWFLSAVMAEFSLRGWL